MEEKHYDAPHLIPFCKVKCAHKNIPHPYLQVIQSYLNLNENDKAKPESTPRCKTERFQNWFLEIFCKRSVDVNLRETMCPQLENLRVWENKSKHAELMHLWDTNEKNIGPLQICCLDLIESSFAEDVILLSNIYCQLSSSRTELHFLCRVILSCLKRKMKWRRQK